MKKAVFLGMERQTARVYPPEVQSLLLSRYAFAADGRTLTKEEIPLYLPELAEVAYVFSTWGMPSFTNEEIRAYFPSLEAVFYAAGSVQHFAREFLGEGVAVYSAWAANGVPVAEYAFAQIVLALKGFFGTLHTPGSGSAWQNKRPDAQYPGCYDVVVGILGAGMIGKMVIDRLHTLERVKILVYDPFLPDSTAAALGVTRTSLAALFEQSDVISNHLANNAQTVGILDGSLFDRMKRHAVFVNTGRGAQVVESDLLAALQASPARAAVLDVTWPEPPAADSPLYTQPNVYLTPHIAGSLGNEVHRMAVYMAEEAARRDAGEPSRYDVTLKMLETMA